MISCENTVQQSEFQNNQNKLIEKAEAYLLSNISAQEVKFQEVLKTEGFKVPAFRVESEPNTLYMVFMSKDGAPEQILVQQHETMRNGNTKFSHYIGLQNGTRNLIGTMTANGQGELLDYNVEKNDFQGPQVTSMPCEEGGEEVNCNDLENETCTGYHYRKMMEAIESNGDTKATCDIMIAGSICSAQAYIAAYAHCKKSH